MLRVLLTVALLSVVASKVSNKEWEHFEGATDESLILGHPAAINAKKMATLMQRQGVVSTCRYILFKAKKNFWDARDACKSVEWPFSHTGAWLADVHNMDENMDIRILLQLANGIHNEGSHFDRANWAWIGLEKTQNNNFMLETEDRGEEGFKPEEWEWQDGTHPNFTHWMRNQPDQEYKRPYKDYQRFVMVNKRGRWDDTFGQMEAPYVCNYCGRYIVIAEHVTWYHAKDLCESYGLTMAIVDSKEDNIELGWAANTTFGPIPEDQRWDDNNWIWLGTQEVMDDAEVGTGEWIHHNGDDMKWAPKWDRKRQPDNRVRKKGEQAVVAFSRLNWRWDDSFAWRKRPFACMCPHRSCSYDHVWKGGPGSGEDGPRKLKKEKAPDSL